MKDRHIVIICAVIIVVSAGITLVNLLYGRRKSDAPMQQVENTDKVEEVSEKKPELPEITHEIKLTTAELSNNKVNFGKVHADTILTAKYSITNTGKEPLIIMNIRPDCRCTSYKYDRRIAGPGEKLTITLTLDTKEKKGYEKIYSTVTLNTDEKFYKLVMEADVI